MRRDVLDLRAFYAAPLGRAARTMLTRKVEEAWGNTRDLDVLGVGYATPFLDAARQGTAAGAANARLRGTGVLDPGTAARILDDVEVTDANLG